MPLHTIPIVIPWQLGTGLQAVNQTTGVQAVATTPQAALAVAKLLVQALAAMRYPGQAMTVDLERAKIGAVGPEVHGLYAYVFGLGSTITQITFSGRIDQDAGSRLHQSLEGIDPARTVGLLMDCVLLSYINSSGLAALAGAGERLNLHLFRLPAPVLKVFQMTGIDRLVPNHADLNTAVAVMITTHLTKSKIKAT